MRTPFTLDTTFTRDRDDEAAPYDVELTWYVEPCERPYCCGRCETLTLDDCSRPDVVLTPEELAEAEEQAREGLGALREP